MGDEVHHLIPQADGGQGVIENAILLCAQCHTDYGNNPLKRKQLQQARDDWYEIVGRWYSASTITEIEGLATRNDVRELAERVHTLGEMLVRNILSGATGSSAAANVASTMVSSLATPVQYSHPAYMPTMVDPLAVPINLRTAENDPKNKS